MSESENRWQELGPYGTDPFEEAWKRAGLHPLPMVSDDLGLDGPRGTKLYPDAQERVCFGIDGAEYQINLTTKHAAELRAVLASYITAARVVRDDQLDLPLPPRPWPLEF